jgi:hypothetical protein
LAVALLVCASVVALIVVRTGTPTFALTTDLIAYSQSRVPLVLINKQDGENVLEEAQGSVLFERIYVFEDEDKADDLSQFVTGHREDDVDHLEPASQPGFYWGLGADSSRTVLVKQYGANIVLIVPAIFFDELPPPDDPSWDLDRMLSDFAASQ